jgi:hypothetical protein
MQEEIIETIEVKDNKAVFFTPRRAIVAKLVGKGTSTGMWLGFGWAGDIAVSKMRSKKLGELSKISPESILTDNKDNFAIPYEETTKWELGKKLKIFTGARKQEFKLEKSKERETYANTLRPVLGDKLVVS